MPNIKEMKESKFLKKEDCGDNGVLVTVRGVQQENVAKAGAPEELKWCLLFQETDLPMVLNSTNMQLAAIACGSEETDNWTGKKLVLYNDPTIQFQGKITGGIRIRAPKNKAAAPTAQKAAAKPAITQLPADDSDDVPF